MNWPKPTEKEDNFIFDLNRDANSPEYLMNIDIRPVGGIDVYESSRTIINSSYDIYTFRTQCHPLVSNKFTVK